MVQAADLSLDTASLHFLSIERLILGRASGYRDAGATTGLAAVCAVQRVRLHVADWGADLC